MASIQTKIERAKSKEFALKASEIKKAEKMACELTGNDCKVTGYFYAGVDKDGFADVICEICSNDMTVREMDITVTCCMWDRRRSWARA